MAFAGMLYMRGKRVAVLSHKDEWQNWDIYFPKIKHRYSMLIILRHDDWYLTKRSVNWGYIVEMRWICKVPFKVPINMIFLGLFLCKDNQKVLETYSIFFPSRDISVINTKIDDVRKYRMEGGNLFMSYKTFSMSPDDCTMCPHLKALTR